VTLWELLSNVSGPIDLLKVDVEGAEHVILSALREAEWHRYMAHVRRVHLEDHDVTSPDCFAGGIARYDTAAWLQGAGFRRGGHVGLWEREA
jgi:hypothetical protein